MAGLAGRIKNAAANIWNKIFPSMHYGWMLDPKPAKQLPAKPETFSSSASFSVSIKRFSINQVEVEEWRRDQSKNS